MTFGMLLAQGEGGGGGGGGGGGAGGGGTGMGELCPSSVTEPSNRTQSKRSDQGGAPRQQPSADSRLVRSREAGRQRTVWRPGVAVEGHRALAPPPREHPRSWRRLIADRVDRLSVIVVQSRRPFVRGGASDPALSRQALRVTLRLRN